MLAEQQRRELSWNVIGLSAIGTDDVWLASASVSVSDVVCVCVCVVFIKQAGHRSIFYSCIRARARRLLLMQLTVIYHNPLLIFFFTIFCFDKRKR
jgi:hypothetical protein